MRTTLVPTLLIAAASLADPRPATRFLVIPTGHEARNWPACRPALSSDGRVIAFEAITALDPADRNGTTDVYVLDRETRRLILVSRTASGAAGHGPSRCPSLSADGRRLVFESDAVDLIGEDGPSAPMVLFADLDSGAIRRLSGPPDDESWPSRVAISADGRTAVFQVRTAGSSALRPAHVFRASLEAHTPAQDLGVGFAPTVSSDGRVIAYLAPASRDARLGVFVMADGVRREVGRAASGQTDASIEAPVLSTDGQWITFMSRATNLMPGRRLSRRAHIYLEHVSDGRRFLVSATPDRAEGNGHSGRPVVDGPATRVVFQSTATNLPCGRPRRECDDDINLVSDIFVWARGSGDLARVNVPTPALRWLGKSVAPVISADGRVIAFFSCQPVNDDDDRGTFDLFVTEW